MVLDILYAIWHTKYIKQVNRQDMEQTQTIEDYIEEIVNADNDISGRIKVNIGEIDYLYFQLSI